MPVPCRLCTRPLRSVTSVMVGVGPVCLKRQRAAMQAMLRDLRNETTLETMLRSHRATMDEVHSVQATAAQAEWAKAHAQKIFANEPAVFVNEAVFIKTFYHKFHPITTGPNLAPPLPKGTTMAQWNAAVTEAKDNLNSLQNMNWKTGMPGQYSPMATKTQWFNDPSDPFFNKRFSVKDLKNGFVISHKPLVIVSRLDGEIDVMQYVGGGNQGTLWLGEQVNKKGYTVDVGYALSNVPNGATPYFHPYKNLGIKVNAVTAQNLTWAAGGGVNIVPLPHWNPTWVLQPIGSSA